jgi:aminoglycoside phosphotransferase (APT) family kinase protein
VVVSTAGWLDLEALRLVLDRQLPNQVGPSLTATPMAGGRSNLTYLLTDGLSRWVLRRPPLGTVLATAHDMTREYRLLSALHPTNVPVPAPLLLADASELGFPFYVMAHAAGEVLRQSRQLALLGGEPARSLAHNLIDTLAELHALEPSGVGLDGLGRPAGFLTRQVERWLRQVAASRTGPRPELDVLAGELLAGLPPQQVGSIVHGDYRLDNVLIQGTHAVAAVLDWEMATLGDPYTDLASICVWWDGLSGLDCPVADMPGDVAGFPSSAALVERYAEQTGAHVDHFDWYTAFAFFKIAAIFEGIVDRATSDAGADKAEIAQFGALVPELARRGLHALRS